MRFKKKIMSYSIGVVIISFVITPEIKAARYDVLNMPEMNLFEGLDYDKTLGRSAHEIEVKNKKNKILAYRLILNKVKEGELGEARRDIAGFLIKTPNNPDLYSLMAMVETVDNNIALAKINYKKAIEIDGGHIMAYLGLAKLALLEKQIDKAKEYYSKTLSIDNKNIGVYLILSELAYKEGELELAIDKLLEGYEVVKGDIDAEVKLLSVLGKLYVLKSQPKKVLSLSQGLVNRMPKSSKALAVLAGAQLINNDKGGAEISLLQLLTVQPRNTKQHLILINLLKSQVGKEKQVLKQIDSLIALQPEQLHFLTLKVDYLVRLKQFDKAYKEAFLISQKYPKLDVGVHLIGDVYRAQNKLVQAFSFYQQAYQLDKKEDTLLLMSDTLLKQGKGERAIELLEEELLINNVDNSKVHINLASLYLRRTDYLKAEKHFKIVLSKQPNNIVALNNLAWLYMQQDNVEALSFAKKAFGLAQEDGAIADTYGIVLLKNGYLEEALSVLKKVSKSGYKSFDFKLHLAQAYHANGEDTNAINILQEIVSLEKNIPEKILAIELLKELTE